MEREELGIVHSSDFLVGVVMTGVNLHVALIEIKAMCRIMEWFDSVLAIMIPLLVLTAVAVPGSHIWISLTTVRTIGQTLPRGFAPD